MCDGKSSARREPVTIPRLGFGPLGAPDLLWGLIVFGLTVFGWVAIVQVVFGSL